VMNKADLLTGEQLDEKAWRLGLKDPVAISAKTGAGFERLMGAIEERLGASRQVSAPDGRVNVPT